MSGYETGGHYTVVNLGPRRNKNRLLRLFNAALSDADIQLPAPTRDRLWRALLAAQEREGLVLTWQTGRRE